MKNTNIQKLNPERIFEMTQLKILHEERQGKRQARPRKKPARAFIAIATATAAAALLLFVGVLVVLQNGMTKTTEEGGVSTALVPIPRYTSEHAEQSGYTVSKAGSYYQGKQSIYSLPAGLECLQYQWQEDGSHLSNWAEDSSFLDGTAYIDIQISEYPQVLVDAAAEEDFPVFKSKTIEVEGPEDYFYIILLLWPQNIQIDLEVLEIEEATVNGYSALRMISAMCINEEGVPVPEIEGEDTYYYEQWHVQGPDGTIVVDFQNYHFVNQQDEFSQWTQDIMSTFLLDYEDVVPEPAPTFDSTPEPAPQAPVLPVPQHWDDGKGKSGTNAEYTVSQADARYQNDFLDFDYSLPAGYDCDFMQQAYLAADAARDWQYTEWIAGGRGNDDLSARVTMKEYGLKAVLSSVQTAVDFETDGTADDWFAYACNDGEAASQAYLESIHLEMERFKLNGCNAIRLTMQDVFDAAAEEHQKQTAYAEVWILDTLGGTLVVQLTNANLLDQQEAFTQWAWDIMRNFRFGFLSQSAELTPTPDPWDTPSPDWPTPTPEPIPYDNWDVEHTPVPSELLTNILDAKYDGLFLPSGATPVWTENSYQSASSYIQMERVEKGNVQYWVADIYVRHVESLAASYMMNSEQRLPVSVLHSQIGALLTINTDYWLHAQSSHGWFVRNGAELKRNAETALDGDLCVLYRDGSMEIYEKESFLTAYQNGEIGFDSITERHPFHVFYFGPSLLDAQGHAKTEFTTQGMVAAQNPRTVLGYYEPGHYVFICVEGARAIRDADFKEIGTGSSAGMTFAELAVLCEELGLKAAYNLDGGSSSTMLFGDQLYGHNDRAVPDVLSIIEIG